MRELFFFAIKAVMAIFAIILFKGLIHRNELGLKPMEHQKVIEAVATFIVCLLAAI